MELKNTIFPGSSLANKPGFFDRLPVSKTARAEKKKRDAARKTQEETYKKSFADGNDYDRGLFVARENTGVAVNGQLQKERGLDSGTVHISENLKSQYKQFLVDFVYRLNNVKRIDPATGQRRNDFVGTVFEHPRFAHERVLYEMITDVNCHVDTSKIEALLQTSKGITTVEEIMEDHLAKKLFGMGLQIFADPRGDRGAGYGTGAVLMNIDRGLMNKVFEGHVLPWLRSTASGGRLSQSESLLRERWEKLVLTSGLAFAMGSVAQYGIAALGVIVGAGLSPLGLAPGAVGAASGLAVAALINSSRRGFHVDRSFCGAAFERIANNQEEKDYVEQVFGIYTDDFVHTGDNFSYRPGHTPRTASRDKLVEDAMKMMYTRFQYHAEIGVDVKDVDALLEQGILQGNVVGGHLDGRATPLEQGGTIAKERIKTIYLQLYPQGLNPYAGVAGNPFNRTDEAEMYYRLYYLSEARRKYINENLNSMLQEAQMKKLVDQEAAMKTGLSQKKADYIIPSPGSSDPGGKIYSAEIDRLNTQEKRLQDDRSTISTELTQIRAYIDNERPVSDAERMINTRLVELHLDQPSLGMAGLPNANQGEIETSALLVLNRTLIDHAPGIYPPGLRIDGQPLPADTISHRRETIRTTAIADIAGFHGPVAVAETAYRTEKTAVADAERERERVGDRIKLLGTDIHALDAQRGTYMSKSADAAVQAAFLSDIQKRIDNLDKQLKTAATQLRRANTDLSAAETRRDTAQAVLDLAQQTERTETQNREAQRDRELATLQQQEERLTRERDEIRTMIQDRDKARTQAADNARANPDIQAAERLTRLVSGEYAAQRVLFGTFGITNAQLEALSIEQIMALVNARAAIVPPTLGSWPPNENQNESRRQQVLHAQIAARIWRISLLAPITNVHRIMALEEYIQALDAQITTVEGNRNNFVNTPRGQEIAERSREIQLAINMNDQREKLASDNSLIQGFARLTVNQPEFIIPIPTTDQSLTAEERNTGVGADAIIPGVDFRMLPRAYFDMLQLLTDYQSQPDRGATFRRIAQAMPPGRLSQLIIDNMPPPFGAGLPITIDAIANQFQNALMWQYVQPDSIRNCLRGIINTEGRLVLALP